MESSITSNRVRTIAAEAIENYGRPMTTHEIENYIKLNDHELYKEIKTKCYDYVRMILSVTKISPFVKYKCLRRIIGIDKRANFFGFQDANYDPNLWINAEKRTNNKEMVTNNQQQINNQQQNNNMPMNNVVENPIKYIEVDEQTAIKSLNDIRSQVPSNDPILISLAEAIEEVKMYREKGFSEDDTVRYAISKYNHLQNPLLIQYVINVLSRVAFESNSFNIFTNFTSMALTALQ